MKCRVCEKCGAALDPGEHCDCEAQSDEKKCKESDKV